MKRKSFSTLLLLVVTLPAFSQKILKEATLRYSMSTLLEHPTMGGGPAKEKDLKIIFTEEFLRINSQLGKSEFQKITSCTGTQTDVYANNGVSFYLVQTPRTDDFFELGPLGKVSPTITYSEDTATFQGFACKKAIVESALSKDDKRVMEVWYLPDYQIKAECFNYYFRDLKGIPVVIRYHEKSRMEVAGQNLMVTMEYKLLTLDVHSPARSITTIANRKAYKLVPEPERAARLMEIAMSMGTQNNTKTITPEGKLSETTMNGLEVKTITTNPFEIGTVLPAFSGEGLDGELISSDRYKGKVLVINFWFVQCPPCIEEMPVLNAVKKNSDPDEVEFLSITFNTADIVTRFLTSKEFTFDKIVNAKELIKKLNVTSYPVTIVVDKKGVIQYSVSGSMLSSSELLSQIKMAGTD